MENVRANMHATEVKIAKMTEIKQLYQEVQPIQDRECDREADVEVH